MAGEADSFILLILAFLFPPAAVAFIAGCGADLCLNILLTLLGWLPGCLHAFWLIIKRTEANETYGQNNWTYAGMGEYRARTQGAPGAQYPGGAQPPPPPQGPPPPPAQYPAGNAPPPSQAPVDQKGGYGPAPPPAPAESKSGGYQAADQKSVPPLAPADQKYSGDQAPPPQQQQAPADQKQADSTTQSAAPPSGT